MPAPTVRTRFVLIQTSHAGNVGAVARAMRTMGFDDLVLVAPRWPDVLTMPEAIERASGADAVLRGARVVATLDEALTDMHHVCATAMVPRDFGPPTASPRAHFAALRERWMATEKTGESTAEIASENTPEFTSQHPDQTQGVAFVFGSERYGMRNEDVYRCHVALQIPSDPAFGSLNLAAAVQVIAYEWRLLLDALGQPYAASASASASTSAASSAATAAPAPSHAKASPDTPADAAQVAAMLEHWQQALVAVGYLDPQAPKKLMPRLRQLFNRAGPTEQEIHILRGIAKSMLYTAARAEKAENYQSK